MINIAIVEDDKAVVAQLKEYIAKYMSENDIDYTAEVFGSAESFLFGGANSFDIILMDIQLPEMDGMSAVRELRKTNEQVVVVFVTSLAQYALKGYEVGALDFMVKPINYYGFALKFRRAVSAAEHNRDENIVIRNKTQVNVVRIRDIYYIEIASHTVNYHTRTGTITATGTMKKISEELAGYHFSLCNQSYLVNLRYVMCADGQEVVVAGEKLVMSRSRRKEFMHDLNEYLAGHTGKE